MPSSVALEDWGTNELSIMLHIKQRHDTLTCMHMSETLSYSVNDAIIHSLIWVKVLGPTDGLLYLFGLMICVFTQYPDLH